MIKKRLRNVRSFLYNKRLVKKLKNRNPTLISNNCIGGVIYHQLSLQFACPLINTLIDPYDFVLLCSNLKSYFEGNLVEKQFNCYPVGLLVPSETRLKNITIHFVHENTFKEAKEKWIRRIDRVNYNNIFVILDLCNYSKFDDPLLKKFLSLNLKKILLYNKQYRTKQLDYGSCFGINFGKTYHVAKILDTYRSGYFFNQFNFVKWFNNE